MNERITTAFRLAGRAWTPGPVPADMPPEDLAWARANGLLARPDELAPPKRAAHARAPLSKGAAERSEAGGFNAGAGASAQGPEGSAPSPNPPGADAPPPFDKGGKDKTARRKG